MALLVATTLLSGWILTPPVTKTPRCAPPAAQLDYDGKRGLAVLQELGARAMGLATDGITETAASTPTGANAALKQEILSLLAPHGSPSTAHTPRCPTKTASLQPDGQATRSSLAPAAA